MHSRRNLTLQRRDFLKATGGALGLVTAGHGLSALGGSAAVAIHVSKRGDDRNPGTEARPVAGLGRAVELALAAGGPAEIVMRAGVYAGDVVIGQPEKQESGLSPLSIRAATLPGGAFEEVILDGARKIDAAEPVRGMPGVFSVDGGFSYYDRPHMWETDTRMRYTLAADLTAVARYPASFWYDADRVYFHTSDARPADAHAIGLSRDRAGITVWRPNVTVRGLRFHSFVSSRWSAGVEVRVSDASVEECRAWNCRQGFQIRASPSTPVEDLPARVRVLRCRADDCGGGIYSHGNRAVVEDCRLFKIRDRFLLPVYSQDDTAIQFYSPAFEGEVRRNLGVGFINGIFVKSPPGSEFIVENNTMVEGTFFGIGCTAWHPRSVFRGNIVVGFSDPIVGLRGIPPKAVVDFNCFWMPGGKGGMGPFLEGARSRGTGMHSIVADPRFASPAAGDYRLLPDSPCARLGPRGEPSGAFGVVGADFRNRQPPEVTLSIAAPGRRADPIGQLWYEQDPRMGGCPTRIDPLPVEERGGEWLVSEAHATLEIAAQYVLSRPTHLRVRVGAESWSEKRPFRTSVPIRLPAGESRIIVGVKVADAEGNWSEPSYLALRRTDRGPALLGSPTVYANDHGVLVLFATDRSCRAAIEFGRDRSYGDTWELPGEAVRGWLPGPGKADQAAPPIRVVHQAALIVPRVRQGGRYHYRIVLRDALGGATLTEDAVFEMKGPLQTHYVSPEGVDIEGGGTRERPWRTLQYALDRTLPGTRVRLLPGFYPGEHVLTRGGLPGAPITIEAEKRGAAVLDARHELQSCLRLEQAPHVTIDGLELRWFGQSDTFYLRDRAGVRAEDSPGVTVRNCTIWNDFWAVWPISSGIYARRSPGFVAEHNVILRVEQGIMLWDSPRSRIVHNTILKNLYGAVRFLYSAEGTVSRNNSFSFSGNEQYLVLYRDPKELESFDSDYNNLGTRLRQPDPDDVFVSEEPFFRSHGSKTVITLNGRGFNSLRAWQEETGKDRHSIFMDPRYVDPENRDYRLRPDSPNLGGGKGGATIGALGQVTRGAVAL